MNKSFALLAALVIGTTMLPEPASAATMYAVGFSDTNSPVYTIDTVTGTQTLLGNSGIAQLNSLAMSPSGVLYSANMNQLVTIDLTTGVATPVATMTTGTAQTNIRSIAFNDAGTLYAVNQPAAGMSQSGTGRLFTVNTTTGATTLIGGTAQMVQGLDFAPDGTLYGVSPTVAGGTSASSLMTINPASGAFTNVGATFTNTFESIAFDPSGILWGVETGGASGQLSIFNPTTGARPLMFSTGLDPNLRGIEFAAVPVPAAVWLFGSGMAAMVGFARRRANH
ncbi:hypothetical protein W02_42160 [Nitrospira sp. KM1]|uniref:VPLPA-CTERM sorting domain-containing protein n=1 Tax=Nitrospira sp. KM1 TaxID=1936990 RepID=UPI0013A7960C|nr:VPLPA-CTERM sorting domain-containing protein [Nitrospira sp. KM1]BCA57076.1 hypothetical protein W02_42160 [Nitrospira sp. KM1]